MNILNPTIIFENGDFAVIHKPAGLLVHPTPDANQQSLTLVDWLLHKYPAIATVGDDPARPGIVHRLDKETSGVMVIAKTQDAFDQLKMQFQNHKIEKTYIALVWGNMPTQQGVINYPIAKSKHGTKRTVRRSDSETNRPAQTDWNVIERYVDVEQILSLLSLEPQTGRTHQIRVHCAAIGHPIVGDYLYGGKTSRGYRTRLPRIFLHANHLAFSVNKTSYTFDDPLPDELNDFLQSLKSYTPVAE